MSNSSSPRGIAHNFGLFWLAGVALLVLLGAILFSMSNSGTTSSADSPTAQEAGASLMVYCASGLRKPVEEIAARYRERYGVEINIQYGGSNTLLSQLELARSGDLYLAADGSYLEQARQKGLVRETLPLASMQAVIVVPKGNPKQISGLADLLRTDVRAGIGNPDQAASGKVVRDALQSLGQWQPLEAAITARGVFQPTVSEVANAVKVGAVDAGIVWDSTIAGDPALMAISPPEFAAAVGETSLGVLESCRQPVAALRFARFMASRDQGLPVFAKAGFGVVEGDIWQESPEITFFCGAVNRRAVEPLVAEFEQREGVRVNTVYNGCGILTGQMKVITDWQNGRGFPDTYMACDRYYLDVVEDQFQDAVDVSETEVVIAVPRGNPMQIRTLRDLTQEGVRLAVGQPKQCTIGVLTRNILEQEGILDAAMQKVVAETCSSALLIPMVVTGSVNAAFVYESDTLATRDQVDVVRIASPAARAIQPFSIAKISSNKWLSRRFFQTLERHEEQFLRAGFRWRLSDSADTEGQDRP